MSDTVGDIYPEANVSVPLFKFAVISNRDCSYEDINEYAGQKIFFLNGRFWKSFGFEKLGLRGQTVFITAYNHVNVPLHFSSTCIVYRRLLADVVDQNSEGRRQGLLKN